MLGIIISLNCRLIRCQGGGGKDNEKEKYPIISFQTRIISIHGRHLIKSQQFIVNNSQFTNIKLNVCTELQVDLFPPV